MKVKMKTITEREYLTCLEFVFKTDSALEKGELKIDNRDSKIVRLVLDDPDETSKKLELLRDVLGYRNLFCRGGKLPIENCDKGRLHDAFKHSYEQCKKKLQKYKERDYLVTDAARAQRSLNYAVNDDGDVVPKYAVHFDGLEKIV